MHIIICIFNLTQNLPVFNPGHNGATSTCYTLQDTKKIRAFRYESAHWSRDHRCTAMLRRINLRILSCPGILYNVSADLPRLMDEQRKA